MRCGCFPERYVPILILVIIPLLVTGLSYLFEGVYSIYGYDFVIADLLYILVFAYALYPIKYSNALFFTKRGPKNAVNEYRYVVKILCVVTPLSIISIIRYRIFDADIVNFIFENPAIHSVRNYLNYISLS